MKIPERACRLELDLQADTREEMVRALETIATAIDRSEMSTGCSGGVHSGWTYAYVENDRPTHGEYHSQLKAYLAAKRAAQETPAGYDPHDHTHAAHKAQETRSDSFGLEINGEAQQVKKCPTCDRDFIGGASDRYCGSDHCVLEPEQRLNR